MESSPHVKTCGITTVGSGRPVRPPGKTYPLSALDHSMASHHLRIVFYYAAAAGDVNLKSLEESLTEVLSFYPPVTGPLQRRDDSGNWEVKCSDRGVTFIATKVEGSLDQWLTSAHGSKDKELHLTHWIDMPHDPSLWSPFYVQINEFEGGGIAIGISCTHMHADPTCATLIAKAWSDMHCKSTIAFPPFFHPAGLRGRSEPNIDTKTSEYYASKSTSKPPPDVKMSTATIRFSDASIKKCLTKAQTKCPNATPFDVLAALFWSQVTAAKVSMQVKQAHTTVLSLCIDFRKLMHTPLPHGFYGNALHFSSVSCGASDVVEGGVEFTADLIHRHLSTISEEEFWSAIEWLESKKDKEGKFALPFRMYGPELTCANFEHVAAYGTMFEKDVKPVHVGYHVGNVKGDGLILVLPSPEEGLSRTVSLTLPVEVLDKVLNDNAILQLGPTVLFIGNH